MIRVEEFCLIPAVTGELNGKSLGGIGPRTTPQLLFPSSSVNKRGGEPFVRGREQMGSLISTPFYLRPAAPARQTPVLSHAEIPQEATLHEGQRSGKRGRLLVLSFKQTHGAVTPLLPLASSQIRYDTPIKLYD